MYFMSLRGYSCGWITFQRVSGVLKLVPVVCRVSKMLDSVLS